MRPYARTSSPRTQLQSLKAPVYREMNKVKNRIATENTRNNNILINTLTPLLFNYPESEERTQKTRLLLDASGIHTANIAVLSKKNEKLMTLYGQLVTAEHRALVTQVFVDGLNDEFQKILKMDGDLRSPSAELRRSVEDVCALVSPAKTKFNLPPVRAYVLPRESVAA